MPQGSLLRHILFALYGNVTSSFGVSHCQYADHSQFYIAAKKDKLTDEVEFAARMYRYGKRLILYQRSFAQTSTAAKL